MPRIALLPLLAITALACSGPGIQGPIDATPDTTDEDASTLTQTCTSPAELEVCEQDVCEVRACRGDETCNEDACVPWYEGALTLDFSLVQDPQDPKSITVEVAPAGFPRERAEAIRYDFGDGRVGWGETHTHMYEGAGVYVVELEVRLEGQRTLRARKRAVVAPGPEYMPLGLTVNDIPEYMNGSAPVLSDAGTPMDPLDDVMEPIRLRVNRENFLINVELREDPGDPIASWSLTSDVSMGDVEPGQDLGDKLTFGQAGVRGTWLVNASGAAPQGETTLTLRATLESGRSVEKALTVETVTLTPDIDPMDRPMIWLFRTDIDFFSPSKSEEAGSGFRIASVQAPDGVPDFVGELRLLGAQGPDEALNAVYLGWIQEAIRTEVYRFFGIAPDGTPTDDIALKVYWQGEEGAPDPSSYAPEGEMSMMRFGGFFPAGFIGYSKYSAHNQERINDATIDYGVATASILSALTSTPIITRALDPLKPGDGVPVGEGEHDAMILSEGFDPWEEHPEAVLARWRELRDTAKYIALAVALVTAHEMGHAMGLIPSGIPPQGFFGERGDISFVRAEFTNGLHTSLPGLNLMQAGGGDYLALFAQLRSYAGLQPGTNLIELAQILSKETRLSSLARAYLQRRLTYAKRPR